MDGLVDLVSPVRAALLTVECQEGVLGASPAFPALAEAAQRGGMLAKVSRLLRAARAAGVPVVHCTARQRPDARGSNHNARLFAAARSGRGAFDPKQFEVLQELGVEDSDLLLSRIHGLSPMAGTDLDPVLRNMGRSTLVVTGVSVNIAVTNLALDAVNRGYQVVLPRDAVAGVPADYADAVIQHTLSLVATLTTAQAVIDAWGPPTERG